MPWAGGTFTRTDGTRTGTSVWQQAKAALIGILATAHDTHDQDIASGINNCIAKDGSNAATAALNLGGNKVTAVATGTVATDAVNVAQVAAGYQPLNAELTSLAAGAATGLMVRTAAATYVERTITGSGGVVVTNGDGVAGAPAISLSATLQNAVLEVTKQAVTATAGTFNIDLNQGHVVELSLTGTVTSLTFSNVPTSGMPFRVVLNITNTGAFNITSWPGTTNYWVGSVAPTITSGAGGKDTIVVTSNTAASVCRNYVVAQNMG